MNILWVSCLAVIWGFSTMGVLITNEPAIYWGSFFSTIVWALVLSFIEEGK